MKVDLTTARQAEATRDLNLPTEYRTKDQKAAAKLAARRSKDDGAYRSDVAKTYRAPEERLKGRTREYRDFYGGTSTEQPSQKKTAPKFKKFYLNRRRRKTKA